MIVQRIVELLNEDPGLAADLDGRIYPVDWPDAPTFPLVIVQRVGGAGQTTLRGEAGIEEARIQVDVYGDKGYAANQAIAQKVRRLLHGYKGGPTAAPCCIDRSACINSLDLPVVEVKQAGPSLRRRCLEFSVWSLEI